MSPTAFLRLRRGLAPFGVDVSLTDFYPDKYPALMATLPANRSMPPTHNICRPCGNSKTWALSGARSGREGISAAFAPLAV
jgi:hypothetical protein